MQTQTIEQQPFLRVLGKGQGYQFIEAGTEPLGVRPLVLEGMQPCL